MEELSNFINMIGGFAWGPVVIVLLVSTGLLLTVGTRFVQLRKMITAIKLLMQKHEGEGDITPFQALMTSLAATIGTGNIAGVATAIAAGGPGAVFWMWVVGLFGGATKFAEAVLAVKYRVTNEDGEQSGGPMYYIKDGMKEKYGGNWAWLGWLFAFFGFIASFGIGNLAQANSVATALENTINIPTYITGIVLAIAVGLVVIGGIKSIARVTSKVVPIMAAVYFIGSFIALIGFHEHIGAAFELIFDNAFTDKAVGGGLLGTVIRFGVARGLFSNEAGLGSAPIAHAASKVKDPVTQGIIASLGSFIDTLVICTLTALVILISGLVSFDQTGVMSITDGLSGAPLTSEAFAITLGSFGSFIVSFCLIFFSFSTILGWSYYGSKCFEYIAGVKTVKFYLWLFTIITFFGCTWSISLVWNISDAFNGLMALPNLVALIALSPVIFMMLKKYEEKNKK